jgi:hypothetical protein
MIRGMRYGANTSEKDEQIILIELRDRYRDLYPALKLLFHVPNAGKRGRKEDAYGRRYSIEGQELKKQGMVEGALDMHLNVPSCDGLYHGLFIEMKRPGTLTQKAGTLQPSQREMMRLLREHGNRVEVCYRGLEAWNIVCDHLGLTHLKQEV